MKFCRTILFGASYFVLIIAYGVFTKSVVNVGSFYLGVTKNNNFFTELVWFGLIFFILILLSRDIKEKLLTYLYIYIVQGGVKKSVDMLLKEILIQISILFISLFAFILMFIDFNLKYLILETGLLILNFMVIMIFMTVLNIKYDFNLSIFTTCLILVLSTVISGNLYFTKLEPLTILFPLNQAMFFRQTSIWWNSYLVSFIYLTMAYIWALVSIKKIDIK